MKVRMRVGVKGMAFGRQPSSTYPHFSVKPGDIVECDERTALQMIMTGRAEEKLDGPLGIPYQAPDKNHILPKLAARVAELQTPSLVDQLHTEVQHRRKSGKPETPAECELRRRVFNI